MGNSSKTESTQEDLNKVLEHYSIQQEYIHDPRFHQISIYTIQHLESRNFKDPT
jgi:hypothetical protein